MKKRWLFGLASGVLAAAMCVSFVGCTIKVTDPDNPDIPGPGPGPSTTDQTIANNAISTIRSLYESKDGSSTAEDYTVLGRTKVGDDFYTVEWTVTSEVETYADYVSVGTMDTASSQVTIHITRGELEVPYTLKATVKVNQASATASFSHTIPKLVTVGEGTVGFDFKDAHSGGLAMDASSALVLFNSWASEETPLSEVAVTNAYQGNGQGGNDLANAGGFVKMGTSSKTGEIKLTFAYPVTSIDLDARGWSATDTISVNGATAQTLGTSKSSFTFELSAPTTEVTITSNYRAIIYQLVATWQPDVHHHTWEYEHVDGFRHTRTCTAEDCTLSEKTQTVDCSIVENYCSLCETTYQAEQIVTALYALESGASLPGIFKLSGVVKSITEQSTQFGNATCVITVGTQDVTVYRAVGEGYDTFKVGDTLTVVGSLVDFSGTKEFTQGCYITNVVDGSKDMSDQEKVDAEAESFTLDVSGLKKVNDEVALPETGRYGTTLEWSVTTNNYLRIEANKLVVKSLPDSGSQTFTVTVTIKSGTATPKTKTFSVTLTAATEDVFTPITEPTPGSDYYLAMDIKGKWYYSTGAKSGNYLGTTTDISSAAKVTLAASGTDGYTLVTNGKYIELETSGKYVNIMLKDEQTAGKVWKWNAQYSVFTMDEGGTTYFMGTYDTYRTFNSVAMSHIEEENEYIGKLGTYNGTTPEPEPAGSLELTSKSFSVLDASQKSGYDKYKGTHTVNGYQVTLTDAMVGSEADYQVVQFKKSTGSLKVTGEFTRVTIIVVSAYTTEADYLFSVTVGTTKLTHSLIKTEDTGKTDGGNAVKLYTLEFISTATGAQEFTVGAPTGKAGYAYSIVFDKGTATTPDPDPDPTPGADFDSVTTEFPTDTIPTLQSKVPNKNDTTTESFYVLGAVKSFDDSDYYCNFHIYDADGNDLYVYGLYKEDGSSMINMTTAKTLFDVDDIIVLYGTLKNYNGTVQIVNAWLVQINNEEKTDVAQILLAGIKLTTPVTEDFTLPTLDGKVSWTVTSGTGIAIVDNVAKVTRKEVNQTVVLTATATVGEKTATKEFTIVVSLQKEGYEEIVVTNATLLPNLNSAYGNNGTATIGGYAFSWIGMGNYGLLQMRTNSGTGTSSFWNTEAFKENISKVVFTWAESKDLPSKQNVLKVEFANSADFTDATSQTISFSSKTLEVTVTGEYKYVRITHNNNGAVYLDEVKIICEKSAPAAAVVNTMPEAILPTKEN